MFEISYKELANQSFGAGMRALMTAPVPTHPYGVKFKRVHKAVKAAYKQLEADYEKDCPKPKDEKKVTEEELKAKREFDEAFGKRVVKIEAQKLSINDLKNVTMTGLELESLECILDE